MKNLKFLLILLITLSIGFGCKKDKEDNEPTPPPGPTNTVMTHITGIVYDQNGNALSDVTVTCGNKTTTTNQFGVFAFLNFTSSKERFDVIFEKPNYFTSKRSAVPKSGEYSEIEVTLIPHNWMEASTVSFQSNTSFVLNVGVSGSEITFPANAWIVKGSGASYNGTVYAKAAYLDPTLPDYSKYSIGGLMIGADTQNKEVMLNPYGGLIVEVTGAAGEILDLNSTTPAQISIKIPESLELNAPAQIDLWNNEVRAGGTAGAGGSASKQGDKYVGEVLHFSYWSCEDICPGKANLTGTVVNASGQPVSGVPVIVGSSIVYSGIDGKFTKGVPSGITFNVLIKPGYLGQQANPMQIGPLSDNENYVIPTNFVISNFTTVKGKLVNCQGVGVKGRVFISWYGGSSGALTDNLGNFSVAVANSVYYADLVAFGNNMSATKYININNNPEDIGNVVLCPPIQTGINELTVNGSKFSDFIQKSGYYDSNHNSSSVYASNWDEGMMFEIWFQGNSTGNYTITGHDRNRSGNGGYLYFNEMSHSLESGTISVTKYGAVGQLIEGTFSGVDYEGFQISGKFSVQRESDYR